MKGRCLCAGLGNFSRARPFQKSPTGDKRRGKSYLWRLIPSRKLPSFSGPHLTENGPGGVVCCDNRPACDDKLGFRYYHRNAEKGRRNQGNMVPRFGSLGNDSDQSNVFVLFCLFMLLCWTNVRYQSANNGCEKHP